MVNIIDWDRVAKAKADILHVFEQIKALVVEKKEEWLSKNAAVILVFPL